MTEDEARQKWCPMVRFAERVEPTGNRWTVNDKPALAAKCIASDCMMWRWNHPSGLRKEAWEQVGYCGLAGKALP